MNNLEELKICKTVTLVSPLQQGQILRFKCFKSCSVFHFENLEQIIHVLTAEIQERVEDKTTNKKSFIAEKSSFAKIKRTSSH